MRMIKHILLPLFLLSFLTACNTVKGAGDDVAAAGHAVSNTAKDASQ